jgi:autotransporter translocation and assembly factor TamB
MKRRYKILLWVVAGFLGLLIVLAILVTQTKFLEKQINLTLKSMVEKEYPIRIAIEDISGSVLSGLKFSGITVDYTETGFEYRMLSIDTLTVSYSLADLWNKRWKLKYATISNPRFELRQTKEGRWLLPKFKKAGGLRKSGLFDFQIEDLSLRNGRIALIAQKDSLQFESLNLHGGLIKDRRGWQVKIASGGLRYANDSLNVETLRTTFVIREKDIKLDSLSLATNWGDFVVKGDLELKAKPSFDLEVDARELVLEDLSRVLPDVKLEGKVDLSGDVSGDLRSFGGKTLIDGNFFNRNLNKVKTEWAFKSKELAFQRIDGEVFEAPLAGSGKLNIKTDPPSYSLKCRVENLDLANIIQGDLHSDFTGYVDLTGEGFNDREMRMTMAVNLSKGELDIYDFDSSWGKLEVDFKKVYFHPRFSARYKHTSGTFTGGLEYAGEVDINGEVSFGDLTDFWGKTFLKEIAGRGTATVKVSGKTQDFDIAGNFQSDSAWVYQLYSADVTAEFDLKTFVTNQQGKVSVQLRKGEAWSIPYDSLLGQFTVDSLFVTIDTAYGGNQYAVLGFKGDLNVAREIQPLRVYDGSIIFEGIPLTTGDDTILIDITKEGYLFKQTELYNGKGSLSATGTISYEQDMNLKLEFDDLDIRPWQVLYLPDRVFQGHFSATAELKGNLSNPRITLDGNIDSLRYFDVNLGQLAGTITYQDSILSTEELTLSSSDWEYAARGYVPVNLSFTDITSQRLLDQPQQINFKGNGNRFGVVHLFLPDVEYLDGDFHAEIDITGTPMKPQLDGTIAMQKGEMKLDQLKDPLTDLTLNIRMQNDRIFFDQLRASSEGKALQSKGKRFFGLLSSSKSTRGSIRVQGQMQIKTFNNFLYDLTLTGRNFPFVYEYMDVAGLADFDLRISGETPPAVTGKIAIKQLEYEEPFGSPVTLALAGQKAADPSTLWDWDLNIEAPNNVWVRNSDMNAEFEAEVELFKIDGQLIAYGIATALPGKGGFSLAGKDFRIESGQILFENPEKIDPTLDFLITAPIYEAPEAGAYGTGTGEDVLLRVTGTVSAPEISTLEGSEYSKEQVLEMLVLQRQTGSPQDQNSPFQEKALTSLGASMGSQIVQKFAYGLGVETFYLRPAAGKGFDLGESEITVGGYLTRELYWQYSSKFSTNPNLALQYRLNRNLFLEGNKDRTNLYRVGLNWRWEF